MKSTNGAKWKYCLCKFVSKFKQFNSLRNLPREKFAIGLPGSAWTVVILWYYWLQSASMCGVPQSTSSSLLRCTPDELVVKTKSSLLI